MEFDALQRRHLRARMRSRAHRLSVLRRGTRALRRTIDAYAGVPEYERERIRQLFRDELRAPHLHRSARRALQRFRLGGELRDLTTALLAVSIEDDLRASADLLPFLGELVLVSRAHGIDPRPIFRRVGELSSAVPPGDGRSSMADVLSRFFDSIYYQVVLAPRGDRPKASVRPA